MDYCRIHQSVSMETITNSHIVVVGAGGSYSLITSLARCGVGRLTVLDFDTVEQTNIVRQGYKISDIGNHKVDALGKEVASINPEVIYNGITKNFLDMNDKELDTIFNQADLLLFLTDSFKAQAFGNIVALKYNKPAIWSGWYTQSRTAELFYQIPGHTTACFRCAASSRYKANEHQEVKITSNCNTIFHSQLLDSLIGMMVLAILHRNANTDDVKTSKEYKLFWDSLVPKQGSTPLNFFQFKVHPMGGNKLFEKAYSHLGMSAHNFTSYWQNAEAELKINGYDYDCPDCNGKLHYDVNNSI